MRNSKKLVSESRWKEGTSAYVLSKVCTRAVDNDKYSTWSRLLVD